MDEKQRSKRDETRKGTFSSRIPSFQMGSNYNSMTKEHGAEQVPRPKSINQSLEDREREGGQAGGMWVNVAANRHEKQRLFHKERERDSRTEGRGRLKSPLSCHCDMRGVSRQRLIRQRTRDLFGK